MEFRDLKTQYTKLKPQIDCAVNQVMSDANFISGQPVMQLEKALADYVGRKYCITCGNGTDALSLALMALEIGEEDAVFVPDFTFFASGEAPALAGATPVFVDVERSSFNLSTQSLEMAIEKVLEKGKLTPRAVIVVDLFGQPADYNEIMKVAQKYHLFVIEDAAQGFGGEFAGKRACSFGDISCTSFFPAKPLGCYGDGGAVFTDNDEWMELIRSYCIHGKGNNKYDNVRIGMNSRLDTIQAAILLIKLEAFRKYELEEVNRVARRYTELLQDIVDVPLIKEGFYSSWAQYSILLKDSKQRGEVQTYLKERAIPSMIYYPKPMHQQKAFADFDCQYVDLNVSEELCQKVLSLPMHPYLVEEDVKTVVAGLKCILG